jgi:hypothetical protein
MIVVQLCFCYELDVAGAGAEGVIWRTDEEYQVQKREDSKKQTE